MNYGKNNSLHRHELYDLFKCSIIFRSTRRSSLKWSFSYGNKYFLFSSRQLQHIAKLMAEFGMACAIQNISSSYTISILSYNTVTFKRKKSITLSQYSLKKRYSHKKVSAKIKDCRKENKGLIYFANDTDQLRKTWRANQTQAISARENYQRTKCTIRDYL